MTPVYNGTVLQTSYNNMPSPLYIVNGAAGNREGNSMPSGNQPWSAFQSATIGYATITIANTTALTYHFINSANNTVIDTVTITKA